MGLRTPIAYPFILLVMVFPSADNQQISKCTVSYSSLLTIKDPTTFHLIFSMQGRNTLLKHGNDWAQ